MPKFFTPQKGPNAPIQWSWIELSGPDARDFLQRMSTAQLKGLNPGQGCTSCFLDAKGRIQAYFWLWCLEPNRFAFEFDAGPEVPEGSWKKSLMDFIEHHHFSEQMELKVSTVEPLWILGESPEAPPMGPGSILLINENHWICHHGSREFGESLYSVWGGREQNPQPQISFEQLEALRIQHLQPRVGAEITSETNPLEVGLRHALSDQKGCYPGQEVIERILTQGNPPRRLCKIEGPGVAPSGEGITSAVSTPTGFIALALVGRVQAKIGTQIQTGTIIEISKLD